MEWFGGQVFNLPIENALERGFLVPYNYYPIYVYATEDEEKEIQNTILKKILSCFKNNKCINPEPPCQVVKKPFARYLYGRGKNNSY